MIIQTVTRTQVLVVKSGRLYAEDWCFKGAWRQVRNENGSWRFFGPVKSTLAGTVQDLPEPITVRQ